MEDTFDSCAVPSLNIVVEEIFSSCDKNRNDEVPASTLIEFMKPHLSNHVIGLTQLRYVLDPNDENPPINRKSFYEAMRCWTAKINEGDSKIFNLSFKECDLFDENGVPFHQSTPKPSLEPTTMKNSNDLLDFSNLSATSFNANTKDNSIGMDKLLFIEERYQELEYKHMNTLKELSFVKSQLAASEDQYAEIKQDLDRTNKRLMSEQQVNADLQKTMEHKDDFKEEVNNTKKEKEYAHRMWQLTKKENSSLITQLKNIEYEKEVLERKLSELQRKEEQNKKEFVDLKTIYSFYQNENQLLNKAKADLEEKLQETKSSLEHYMEVSEILKNKVQVLTAARKGNNSGDPNLSRDPSDASNSSGTPVNSPSYQPLLTSSTPLKNLQHFWLHEASSFGSPKLQRQLSSPITPSGLDTPHQVRTIALFNDNDVFLRSSKSPGQSKICSTCNSNSVLLAKSGRSKSLPPVGSMGKSIYKDKKRCYSEKAESSLPSGNSTFETIDDLDLSSFSDNHRTSNGQDLRSELQECKFLDNHNKCYIEDHAELLRIIKEHENCSHIIANKEKEIEIISDGLTTTQEEYKTLLNKYNNIENDIKCLGEHLENSKTENSDLVRKNNDYLIEIENLKQQLNSNNYDTNKISELENENIHLLEGLNVLKEKCEKNTEDIYNLENEKEILQSKFEQLCKEKDELSNEKTNLYKENINLTGIIQIQKNELNKMRNIETKNENLEKEIVMIKLEKDQNLEEINKLSNKLLNCKDNGKNFVNKVNIKVKELNAKIQFLKGSNIKLEEYVSKIQEEMELTKTKLNLLLTYVEDNYVNIKCVNKADDQDSSSTGSNESSSYHNRSKQNSSCKKSNYEKQQLKINKLEEKIEQLQNELSNEKILNEKMKILEYQVNNLELEKVNHEEQRQSILRELEATKYDLCMKEQMLEQFEEKHKFHVDNLNESHEKQIELSKEAEIKAQKEKESTERILKKQIEELKQNLSDLEKEKKVFETMLEKQGEKIIALKKALSDMSTSTEDTKNFEMLVTEKESMLNFNRKLLLKANNSLKEAENRCLFLQLLLDKCKMVLCETVNDVLRSTVEVFHSHRDVLDNNSIDSKVIQQIEILELENFQMDEFTEKEVWMAHNYLTLTSKLLRALVSDNGKQAESCGKNEAVPKGVSKFTLRPSKLQLRRLPSCDPNISSSSVKDSELMENCSKKDEAEKDEETKEAEKKGSILDLAVNDSETNWLDSYSQGMSVQISDVPNNLSETSSEKTEAKKSFRSVGVGDSVINAQQSIAEFSGPSEPQRRKFSSFMMMTSTVICLFAMCILFIHMECVRKGNETIVCPLDLIVSIKKVPPGSSTY